jgi:hypothetical protein
LHDTLPVPARAGAVAGEAADVAALEERIGRVRHQAERRIDIAPREVVLREGAVGGGAEDEGIDALAVERHGAVEIGDRLAVFLLAGECLGAIGQEIWIVGRQSDRRR